MNPGPHLEMIGLALALAWVLGKIAEAVHG